MCMIETADGVSQVLQESKRKARKEHKCSECGRKIRIGERYLYETTLFDGEIEYHKTCAHCQVCRAWLTSNCGGWLYGGIEEDIMEHAHDYRRKDLIRLRWGMGRFWTRRDGELMALPAMPADLGGRDAGVLANG